VEHCLQRLAFSGSGAKVEPDRIQVKLLPTKFEPDLDAKLLLESLGLKPNGEGETAVQQLLRWRLPLSQKLVQEFVNAAQAVPAKERPAFWPAVLSCTAWP